MGARNAEGVWTPLIYRMWRQIMVNLNTHSVFWQCSSVTQKSAPPNCGRRAKRRGEEGNSQLSFFNPNWMKCQVKGGEKKVDAVYATTLIGWRDDDGWCVNSAFFDTQRRARERVTHLYGGVVTLFGLSKISLPFFLLFLLTSQITKTSVNRPDFDQS